jgi:2-(3-amino-3-carboxypropyl)histidine synthase
MTEDFDFELERVVKTIRERKCRKVLLQFPEGLKRQAPAVAATISSRVDAAIIISGEPCFGACDIPSNGTDLVVHYGHLPIPCLNTPNSVLYIQARSCADPVPVLEKALPELGGRIGLLTTVQHIHLLADMLAYLRSKGIEVIVGKGDSRIYSDGQVLGCNASCARSISDDTDMFLFVGTGIFHPLAIALSTPKTVITADPVSGEVGNMEAMKNRILRQRHAAIEKARAAKNFGIIVSAKQGQRRENLALRISQMLSEAGYANAMVEMDLVTPAKLQNLGLDAWVSTACPRLALDDYAAFPVPILTPPEAEIMVGTRSWSNYDFDEIE